MKRKFLKFLFKRYYEYFSWLYCQDLIEDIPKGISDDTLSFLSTYKEKLDKFFRWESYLIQQRISDSKSPQMLLGILVHIKTLSLLTKKNYNIKEENITIQDNLIHNLEENLKGVESFREGFKPKVGNNEQ